jgi:hypothetical protein
VIGHGGHAGSIDESARAAGARDSFLGGMLLR